MGIPDLTREGAPDHPQNCVAALVWLLFEASLAHHTALLVSCAGLSKRTLQLLSIVICGCGAPVSRPLGAEPVELVAGPLPPGPLPPDQAFPILELPGVWTPPQMVAQDLTAFRASLPLDVPLRVEVAPELSSAAWTRASARWAEAWGAVVAATETVQTPLWNRPDHLDLSPDWLSEARAKPQGLVLYLDIDERSLEPGAGSTIGSCRDLQSELMMVSERVRTEMDRFVVHADALLWHVYGTQLEAWLPSLQEEYRVYGEDSGERSGASLVHHCGRAYAQLVERAHACRVDRASCPAVPRFSWDDGAQIRGSRFDAGFEVNARCTEVMSRNAPLELRDMAVETATVAAGVLDGRWLEWVERAGAVAALQRAVATICEPSRRRFAEADLRRMRQELEAIAERLSAPLGTGGRWIVGGDEDVLAEYISPADAPATDVEALARAWAADVEAQARCGESTAGPMLRVTLVDLNQEIVAFDGRVFAEDLRCEDLPPRAGPT